MNDQFTKFFQETVAVSDQVTFVAGKTMARPRSGTERTPCCRRAHRPQRADNATSRIGHEIAPNRLSRLLPHPGFRLGTEGLSRDCGRDTHYWAPPAQNRTGSFPAYGSHLGCLTAGLGLPYALRRRGHAFPALCPARAAPGRVLLCLPPSLPPPPRP